MDYSALKSEIDGNPGTYGGKNPAEIAALLNAEDAGVDFDVVELDAKEMHKEIVVSEFEALTDGKQRAWLAIVGLGSVPLKDARLRSQISAIWGAGTTTRSRLVALQNRKGSRAEQLFGEGVIVTPTDVRRAEAR